MKAVPGSAPRRCPWRPPRSQTGGEPGPEPGRLPVGFVAGQPATCASVVVAQSASRLVLPKPDGGTRSTSGSAADSSFRSRTARGTRGPVGRGTAISWLWTDTLLSVWMALPPGRPGTRHSPARRQRQVHPAAGDTWVMPGHPQPIVGVSATHARTGDVTKCFPGVCRDETPPAHARSESVVSRASRRRGAQGSDHDCKD